MSPAGADQNSASGTQDISPMMHPFFQTRELILGQIITKINTSMASNPNTCFILQGYSQGAAATVDALKSITGAGFTAIRELSSQGRGARILTVKINMCHQYKQIYTCGHSKLATVKPCGNNCANVEVKNTPMARPCERAECRGSSQSQGQS